MGRVIESRGNQSAFAALDYEESIRRTVPYYEEFYRQACGLVKAMGIREALWLDTGCGTGKMAEEAAKYDLVRELVLADPSEEMLEAAKRRLKPLPIPVRYQNVSSQELEYESRFDVATAVLAHHYLDRKQRKLALQKCFRALKRGGVYISFENTASFGERGQELALKRWEEYQLEMGKSPEEAAAHLKRFGEAYFPLTLKEQLAMLLECGFESAEILWYSCMQAGVYGVRG